MRRSSIRYLLPLLLLGGFIVLFWVSIGQPLAEWRAARFTEQNTLRADIMGLQRSVETLELEVRQLSQDHALDMIWRGTNSGEATARMQANINSLAQSSGLKLNSIAPISAEKLPHSDAIGFRVEGEAHLDQLAQFLQTLEQAIPIYLLQRATLRRVDRAGDTSHQPLVFVQFDIAAPIHFDEARID